MTLWPKLLDGPKVNHRHHQAAGERVAQAMPTEARHLCLFQGCLEPAARLPGAAAHKFRALQYFQRLEGSLIQRDVSYIAILASGDRHNAQWDEGILAE